MPALPIGEAEIEARFLDNARLTVSASRAQALRDAILDLDARTGPALAQILAGTD